MDTKSYDYMLPRSWDIFKPGDRVVTTGPILDYPIRPLPAGQTGTVLRSSDELGVVVRMDTHHPDLDPWDNEAHLAFDIGSNFLCDVPPIPLRPMLGADKTSWNNPYTPSADVDMEVVIDRITDHAVNVSDQVEKIMDMAMHFKALGLTGPYERLYLIAAALGDVADEINTTRLGHLGDRKED